MAEFEKTQNYGLDILGEEQTSLTFKEFRQMIAGANDQENPSNMQKIDTILKQCATAIDDNLISSRNYTEEQIAAFKTLNDELIKSTEDDEIIIGGEEGKPIEFRDGSQVSYLQDGVFTVNGVEVDYLRIMDYLFECKEFEDEETGSVVTHLQLSYKPVKTGGVE